jgi:methyl-accepting chemotaxis protein
MFSLLNYRLTTRIVMGFGFMTFVVVALAAASLWSVQSLHAQAAAQLAGVDGAALRIAALQADASTARWLIGAFAGVALFVGIFMGMALHRSIKKPVEEVVAAVSRIAAGDLVTKISSSGRDEIAWLNYELNTMRKKLQTTIADVRAAAEQVEAASGEIASGNSDLSQRTENQASSLQQTASSMGQLTTTVKQNADSAREANTLVAAASDVASRGGSVMNEVVSTMNGINASSQKIADIIGVIDGIAFQTNILALNAAVEAARAGEQGRGFAVVAGEVRNLAQRSAQAAKEIKSLIGSSVDQVGAGARLVEEAGATMKEILTSVKQVTTIVGEIRSASEAQSTDIQQVNDAVDKMDGMTQQNAALVEQAAAAAQSLREQSQRLTQAVGVFKLAVA